jgi:hypothetical protein
MRRPLACALTALLLAAPGAYAALPDGTTAPDFTAEPSLGGNSYSFSLADALKKGPVVLYLYPAAFTQGCTIEAHDFAKAMPGFKALGATVIGVSHDPIPIPTSIRRLMSPTPWPSCGVGTRPTSGPEAHCPE